VLHWTFSFTLQLCVEATSDCLETESGPSVQGDSCDDILMDCTRFWVLKNHVTVMCLQVDVHAVGEALGSAVDVLNALQVSVSSLSPKAESMDVLLSQLAQTAAKERALLEECGDLLSVAATLEVEECSLRTHLIQLESEKGWSSATLPMCGRTITPNHE
jgi:hypothetical protein